MEARKVNHVHPQNDWFPHTLSSSCHCCPQWNGNVWVHNSYDGRELFEEITGRASATLEEWNTQEFWRL